VTNIVIPTANTTFGISTAKFSTLLLTGYITQHFLSLSHIHHKFRQYLISG